MGSGGPRDLAMFIRLKWSLGWACVLIAAWTPVYAQVDDVPPQLEQVSECMLHVLQGEPSVADARIENSESQGQRMPTLIFRQSKDDVFIFKFFFTGVTDGIYLFNANIPGIIRINIDEALIVTQKWKSVCSVQAIMFTG
jgi:hypothetical protein